MALVAGLAGWAGLISATAGGQMSGSSLIREPVHVSGALDARGMACRIAMLAFRGATRYSAKQC